MLNILICGGGQVGSTIGYYLSQENVHVTLIDNDESVASRINDSMDIQAIHGHASHPAVLEKAGARNADMIVAVTNDDEVNMIACQIAHTIFDIPTKIARLRDSDYLNPAYSDMFSDNHMPIDYLISPELEVAKSIERRIKTPGASDVYTMAGGRVQLIGIKVEEPSRLIGKKYTRLEEYLKSIPFEFIGSIREDQLVKNLDKETIQVDDNMYFVTETENTKKLLTALGHKEKEAHKLIIVGGGNIGVELAKRVEDESSMTAKLIEIDETRSKECAAELKNTTVLHGDMLDASFLSDAGLANAETFVAVDQ